MRNVFIKIRGEALDQYTLAMADVLLNYFYFEELGEPSDPEVHLDIEIKYGPTSNPLEE